jgi:hypothetical protein
MSSGWIPCAHAGFMGEEASDWYKQTSDVVKLREMSGADRFFAVRESKMPLRCLQ